MHQATAAGDRRIEGNHFDAAAQRLLERRHQRIRIIGRNRDRIHVLCDQCVEHVDLAFGRRARRSGVDYLHAA